VNSFYKELEHVCDQFPRYHMKTVRRFQCNIRERRHFQTSNQELRVYIKLVIIMGLE